jgi:hypothetical protein
MKLIGLTGTMSEYKVFQVNHETPEEKIKAHPTFRSNFIYLINGLNGKNTIVCQLYDHLKANEINPWIKQVILTYLNARIRIILISKNNPFSSLLKLNSKVLLSSAVKTRQTIWALIQKKYRLLNAYHLIKSIQIVLD